jgi:ATP-binding cassette, subfamily B, bacterial IrtA/YbtP
VVGFAATFAAGVIGHLADNDLQAQLRSRIVEHLRRLPLAWFDARSSGAVSKLVEGDVAALHQLVAHSVQDLTTAVLAPLTALVYLMIVDWRMAVAALLPIVASVVLYGFMLRDGGAKFQEYDASVVRLNSVTVEYVRGISVVKAFGQAGASHGRYRDEIGRFVSFYGGWVRQTTGLQCAIEVVSSPALVLAWLAGVAVWLVALGAGAPVDVLPGLLLGLGLTAPLLQLGYTGQFFRAARKARDEVAAFLDEPVIIQPTQPQAPSGSRIDWRGVRFSYDGERDVLHDITVACIPGTVTALVGPSGSGKSTLASLVPRFADVSAGSVTVGGVDVRDIEAERLYSAVGFVFQDTQLLRASVSDNVRLARPDASDADVERVARLAQVHDRIERLPGGYECVLGEQVSLSGGEAQRITIARALLTDAPILVLDEATAFADPDSETAIQRALSALAAERTLLVIAHRLHTIVGADQILVMNDGRIVERGIHDELLALRGLYWSMWEADASARAGRRVAG